MAKQMRKDIGGFDVPELSHPNYRQLDWGPDLLTKRGFRLFKGVSYWTEKEPHHRSATQCDEPMSPEEIRGLFRKYQNPNVVSFFYDAALLRECDQQQNMIGKNVENLIGCQRALINSRQFMNKCEQRLLKERGMIEDIRVSTDQRPRSRSYLSKKHSLGTILHSPIPFRCYFS
ncbi:hypothetical protein FGIG_08465 [Fasciola gigantica]|uniref:Uncharacterized protein n=1 Tax=Fasciola gigantica TaxID=46835 RepID=A0A504YAY2_FASGI|nr:hypothetical protein FGIG_08465 [Fasciola gigantica]